MKPILFKEESKEDIVKFNLISFDEGLELQAIDNRGSRWVILDILPEGIVFASGIPVMSGIPIDENGKIKIIPRLI